MCTGNICRSPIAEGVLRARSAARGAAIEVASCGISSAGRPATDEAVRAARARGADIAEHRSAVLGHELVDGADLVIAMERQHGREVVLVDADAAAKCFTFKDLVRRAEAASPRADDESPLAWIARIGAGHTARDFVGFDADDEVADPYARSMAAYDVCADELADLIDRLLERAWPPRRAEGAA